MAHEIIVRSQRSRERSFDGRRRRALTRPRRHPVAANDNGLVWPLIPISLSDAFFGRLALLFYRGLNWRRCRDRSSQDIRKLLPWIWRPTEGAPTLLRPGLMAV